MRIRIHRQWEDGKVEALARSREFGWMVYRELKLIAPYLTETTAPAGVTLITEGQLNHNFFLLISGVLEVTQDGHHKRFLRAGESCGATAMSTNELAAETIRTVTAARLLVTGSQQHRGSHHRTAGRSNAQAMRVPGTALVPNPA